MAKHLVQHNQPLPSIQYGLSKKQIASLAKQSVDKVMEDGNVFQVAEALAAMEEFARVVRADENFIGFIREELEKHQGQLLTKGGARIELCEAGVSYDYSCNLEWKELDDQIKELTARKKLIEEKLRRIAPGKIAVDEETGEVTESVPRSSKSTYRVTLAK